MHGAVGDYVRTIDGVGLIFGCEGGSYQVVSMQRDEEHDYSGSELTSWSPVAGERVVEANNERCAGGIVVVTGDRTSLVTWEGFIEPQTWLNAKLEPHCYD